MMFAYYSSYRGKARADRALLDGIQNMQVRELCTKLTALRAFTSKSIQEIATADWSVEPSRWLGNGASNMMLLLSQYMFLRSVGLQFLRQASGSVMELECSSPFRPTARHADC